MAELTAAQALAELHPITGLVARFTRLEEILATAARAEHIASQCQAKIDETDRAVAQANGQIREAELLYTEVSSKVKNQREISVKLDHEIVARETEIRELKLQFDRDKERLTSALTDLRTRHEADLNASLADLREEVARLEGRKSELVADLEHIKARI